MKEESYLERKRIMNTPPFNSFKDMSIVPNIIVSEYLFKNEDIWKLIYYTLDENNNPIVKPLEMPNLTAKQKRALIYQGVDDVNKFRVFFTMFPQNEEINDQIQQVRIYRYRILPSNAFRSSIAWKIDLPCHFGVQTIIVDDIVRNRSDVLQEKILETLNGVEVGGVGTLQFNYDMDTRISDRSDFVKFNVQFSGHSFTLSCNYMRGTVKGC